MRSTPVPLQRTSRFRSKPLFTLFVIGSLSWLTSCTNPSAPPTARGPSKPETSAAEPAQSAQSFALTLNGYKRDVARQVYRSNPQYLYEGQPPPLLKSIVVLKIRVDAKGQINHLSVMRSNGYKELEARAMQSLRNAAPLPMPNRLFMQGGNAEFVETWLFRNDGHFQIRSLAEPQASE